METANETGLQEQNPARHAMLLTALYIAQEQHGWLTPQAIERVAGRFRLPPGQVYATASFYTLFKLAPEGCYRIQVCAGLPCHLVGGAEPVIEQVSRRLNIRPGETTPDGCFSLEVVECLAACGTAPVLRVNDELYEHMTPEKIEALLARLSGS